MARGMTKVRIWEDAPAQDHLPGPHRQPSACTAQSGRGSFQTLTGEEAETGGMWPPARDRGLPAAQKLEEAGRVLGSPETFLSDSWPPGLWGRNFCGGLKLLSLL